MFFVFFLFSTHPSGLPWYFFSVPWEICVFVGSVLCPSFVSIPRQRSISFSDTVSVNKWLLLSWRGCRHPLCRGSISHYLLDLLCNLLFILSLGFSQQGLHSLTLRHRQHPSQRRALYAWYTGPPRITAMISPQHPSEPFTLQMSSLL